MIEDRYYKPTVGAISRSRFLVKSTIIKSPISDLPFASPFIAHLVESEAEDAITPQKSEAIALGM